MVLRLIGRQDYEGKVLEFKAARPNTDGLLATVLNRCCLRVFQRRACRAAMIEWRQRVIVKRVLVRLRGTIKSRDQPRIRIE